MVDSIQAPVLIKPIQPQVITEGATFTFKLHEYIQSPNAESGNLTFFAELSDGAALPSGLICTSDGILVGIPANETHGSYDLTIMVENDSGIPLAVPMELIIKERIKLSDVNQHFTDLKAKAWEALGEGLPIPELSELLNRPISHDDIYYLFQQYATLKIWDVYNLDSPGAPHLLDLAGISKHYKVYDRGCYIIGVPKDLFSHERTLEDALMTAKAMAREVYKRDWTIEFTGFGKMARAAWVELRVLADKYEKAIEVIHYNPTSSDMRIYDEERKSDAVFGVSRAIEGKK